MTEPVPPLPPALASLFADERAAAAEPADARAQIRARLGATLAIGAVAAGAAATGTSSTAAAATTTAGATAGAAGAGAIVSGIGGKLVVLLLSVGIVGAGGALVATHGSSHAAPARIATAVVAAVAPPAEVAPAAVTPPPPPPVPSKHVVSTAARVRTTVAAPPPPAIASEPQLLTRAWAAIEANDATAALALVVQDRDAHPDGALAEERDAVEVLALAHLSRVAEARTAADVFASRYPTSVHRRALDRALDQGSP